jgi:hypothetical protein
MLEKGKLEIAGCDDTKIRKADSPIAKLFRGCLRDILYAGA